MRVFIWLLRGLLFFVLFAFALNNAQDGVVHWFFGYQWRAPMVIIVLAAVTAGAALTFALMLPAMWRMRRSPGASAPSDAPPAAQAIAPTEDAPRRNGLRGRTVPAAGAGTGASSGSDLVPLDHPPREGL